MTPALIGSIVTFICQLLIAGALTFMILETRRLNRELKALRQWVFEINETLPMRARNLRIAPGQAASSVRQQSGEGPQGSGNTHTEGKPYDPRRWN